MFFGFCIGEAVHDRPAERIAPVAPVATTTPIADLGVPTPIIDWSQAWGSATRRGTDDQLVMLNTYRDSLWCDADGKTCYLSDRALTDREKLRVMTLSYRVSNARSMQYYEMASGYRDQAAGYEHEAQMWLKEMQAVAHELCPVTETLTVRGATGDKAVQTDAENISDGTLVTCGW